MDILCRDCCTALKADSAICPHCGSHRLLRHEELFRLHIAHVDADAFFASVEKRDNPDLADKPVIVGGGHRGVVSTCCYIARISGVRSAMPMFKAQKLCPDAVVIKPDLAKYAHEGRQIRMLMQTMTPLVQPMSIDEAVMDLSGTEALHNAPPAVVLARFALAVEREIGVTVSIGLAPNRLLAKIAVERNKPRGFAVIGAAEAAALLAPERVSLLPGVGPALTAKLERHGITRLGQLQAMDLRSAMQLLGDDAATLLGRARGQDTRPVTPERETKSISAETTFDTDISDRVELERHLWRMSEKLASRLYAEGFAAAGIVLKLKTADFTQRTRNRRLPDPSRLPDVLFDAAREMLAKEATGTRFRLIGIGAQPLADAADADRGNLADPDAPKRAKTQDALNALRAKFGTRIIGKGRGL